MLFTTNFLFAQKPSHSYVDENINLFWNKSVPVHLFISNSPDGEKTELISVKPKTMLIHFSWIRKVSTI